MNELPYYIIIKIFNNKKEQKVKKKKKKKGKGKNDEVFSNRQLNLLLRKEKYFIVIF